MSNQTTSQAGERTQEEMADRLDRIETAKETFRTCNGIKARRFYSQKFPYSDHRELTLEQVRAALINSLPEF